MNAKLGAAAALLVCVCSLCFVGTAPGLIVRGDAAYVNDLRELVDTPAVSGYETQLSNKIRDELSAFHPTVDNLGDVVVTVGSGAPHRLVAAPIDEPGYVVSAITSDGYLRLRRVPLSGLPPIFNEFYSAQPVQVGASGSKWLDGVVAGLSIHLQPGRVAPPDPRDIDNMYVDIGASSASEVRRSGVDILDPVAIDRKLATLNNAEASAASVGDKFGAAAVMAFLQGMDRSKLSGTLTVAFVTQEWSGGRSLHRILATTPSDEFIYVGRMQPNLPTAANPVPQKSPQRHPGSGVLLGFEETDAAQRGIAADLKQLAATNKIASENDYSAVPVDAGYDGPFVFPVNWAHIGIATAWPNTPVETIDLSDLRGLIDLLGLRYGIGPQSQRQSTVITSGLASGESSRPTNEEMLRHLVTSYGTSNHEAAVRDAVKKLLPEWAKTETDDAGNLIMRVGTAPAAAKSPKILVVAHTDEIGFEVKSIDADGVLEATATGGMYLSYFLGHPAYVHTQTSIRDAIMLPPNGWDQPNFKWPVSTNSISQVDVGAHSREEAAALGIKPGDFITIPKEYRTMLGARAIGRSFDDRVGDTALVSAVWALGAPLKDRDVTFVWSTGEELGLDGARALAKRLATENREPDYVFAVDTFVSSDSPLESQRFGDAQIGKGFVIRALDGSNVVPQKDVDRLVRLARANQIPVQYGVTGGGNDGSEFVPYGSIDVAIAWPLRYAHSPGEVIDTRDVDSLARIVAVVAKEW